MFGVEAEPNVWVGKSRLRLGVRLGDREIKPELSWYSQASAFSHTIILLGDDKDGPVSWYPVRNIMNDETYKFKYTYAQI